ncbi:MAG: GFA family protein [Henriciella sp.]|uniref:GFA family protein n=1 Tax=Henriciella sp. TaxID=1968823 RepID=UPI0032EB63F9
MPEDFRTYAGGCHCSGVRFEVDLPDHVEVEDCNCSICAMSGNDHIIVPSSRFRLTQGEERLTEYRFNTGAARHLFCKVCGIKSFYVPRSNPDGYAVTWRCLDDGETLDAMVTGFDGQNWEANAARLAHKSKA